MKMYIVSVKKQAPTEILVQKIQVNFNTPYFKLVT